MTGKVADFTSALPGEASLQRFFEQLEERQRRVAMAGQSYNALLESAKEAGDARKSLAYFVVTASAAVFTGYVALLARTDVASEVIRHFIPAFGLALCYVVMLRGIARYFEECTYVAQGIEVERTDGIENGAAATRAALLQYDNWWSPPREHFAAFSTSLFWTVTFVVQAWHG